MPPAAGYPILPSSLGSRPALISLERKTELTAYCRQLQEVAIRIEEFNRIDNARVSRRARPAIPPTRPPAFTPQKAGLLLHEEDAAGAPISTSTLDVWVAAVMELYRRQCSMRKNGYPNPRGDALTSKIDTYRRDHDARKRAAFVDRGLDGIVAGYSDAEFLRLQRCLLDRSQGSDGVFFRMWLTVPSPRWK